MLGSYVACRPIGKKIALVQCAASAASTAGVFFGHGPSSKVSTTSPSRRKSCALKCSKPKPGPPVVSISTTRETPSALRLLHEAGMAEGSGAAAWATAAGASAARADPAAGFMSVTAATGARRSVGVTWAGWGAGTGLFCQKMAPNTATHSTIASADAIVARRMSDPPNWGPKPNECNGPKFRPMSLNPTLSGQFEAEATKPAIIRQKRSPKAALVTTSRQRGCGRSKPESITAASTYGFRLRSAASTQASGHLP